MKSKEIIENEKKRLGLGIDQPTAGLALSGGGIRSASFGLGVLQALLQHGVLDRIDYLSTVSGGGYIGAALTWFRKRHAGQNGNFFDKTNPFGEPYEGARTLLEPQEGGTSQGMKNTFLSFLRQHSRYLTPTTRINVMSLSATVIRNLIVSVLVYLAMVVVLVSFLGAVSHYACALPVIKDLAHAVSMLEITKSPESSTITIDCPEDGGDCTVASKRVAAASSQPSKTWGDHTLFQLAILVTAAAIVLIIVVAIFYSIASKKKDPYQTSRIDPVNPDKDNDGDQKKGARYSLRTAVQILCGRLLLVAIIFGVLATVPIAQAYTQKHIAILGLAGYLSGVWAALAKVRQHLQQSSIFKKQMVGNLLFRLGAALFAYSMLIIAYHLSLKWLNIPPTVADHFEANALLCAGVFLLLFILVGAITNINHSTIGRMYRDRLMEVFLPNEEAIKDNMWYRATEADGALLADMCQDDKSDVIRPYHIINTNVIMVNANQQKYKGRGGDSFILSPYYCGSDATEYIETSQFLKKNDKGWLTLATAMATSGAAVSPNTGVGGIGVTRDFFVSLMMTVFNLRLGYWATNPHNQSPLKSPNYWWPGLCSLLGFGYHESSLFIELTDGGHFENLGLYELIRRRVDTIIVSDAGADKNFNFGDLANAIERVRVDFGVGIRFKPEEKSFGPMLPESFPDGVFSNKFKLAEKGFAKGTITYPGVGSERSKTGTIFVIKSTLLPALPMDLYGYKARHKDFPDQTTADQFFDENQFEAYRELGYRAADQLCTAVPRAGI